MPDARLERDERDALRLPLHDLRRNPRTRREVVVDVAVEGVAVSDTAVDADTDVHIELTLESAAEGVTASGSISGRWTGPCNLCLEAVGGDLRAEVHELFADQPLDEETYRLDAETIDIEPMVRDALALELPLLARCPFGGVGSCDRVPDQITAATTVEGSDGGRSGTDAADESGPDEAARLADPRWAALDAIEFDD